MAQLLRLVLITTWVILLFPVQAEARSENRPRDKSDQRSARGAAGSQRQRIFRLDKRSGKIAAVRGRARSPGQAKGKQDGKNSWKILDSNHDSVSKPSMADRTLKAMELELKRSFVSLSQLSPAAYFIAYRIYDTEKTEISASEGVLSGSFTPCDQNAEIQVELRLGSPELDNYHPLDEDNGSDESTKDCVVQHGVPLFGANEQVLRKSLWLETDTAYRNATERYARVLGQEGLSNKEKCKDFSIEKPTLKIDSAVCREAAVLDLDRIAGRCKELSAIYKKYSEIEDSTVSLNVERVRHFIVNTEGTRVADQRISVYLTTEARACALKGDKVSRVESTFYRTAEEFMGDKKKLESLVEDVARSVTALRRAPPAEPFCGPVILKGSASAVMFHEVLGHRLESSRHRESSDGRTFTKMLGRNILPSFISVFDRPLLSCLNGVPLAGHYNIDDDGIVAQDVTLVERGRLNGFLVGRTPVPHFLHSNGHGRTGGGDNSLPKSRMANLIVVSSKATTDAGLRSRLISEAKRQKKPYGLVIERAESGETSTTSYDPQVFQVYPSIVKRVYVDGRPDQLVRGVRIIGTPMAALQHVIETSTSTEVFNGYCGADSGSIPQANCSPAVLIDYLETDRQSPDSSTSRLLGAPTNDATEKSMTRDSNSDEKGDVVLLAMKDELNRSMHIKTAGKSEPYFANYLVDEMNIESVCYELGSCSQRTRSSSRYANVDLRIGSHEFDSGSNIMRKTAQESSTYLPLEDDYLPIRRKLWLITDDIYKQKCKDFEEYVAYKNRHKVRHLCESFSAESTHREITPSTRSKGLPVEFRQRLADASALFQKYPLIRSSYIAADFHGQTRRLVTSEGTVSRYDCAPIDVSVVAYARTADGTNIWDIDYLNLSDHSQLPAKEELEQRIRKFAANLSSECNAERRDYYYGPVLFAPPAAAELVVNSIAPLLCAEPGDNFEQSGTLLQCMSTRVLPPFLNIFDDPTAVSFKGQNIGARRGAFVDDEGIRPQKVSLIEHGFLKNLLSGRTPVYPGEHSNGHGFTHTILATNLFVQCDPNGASSSAAMKEKLIELAKARGLKEALMICRIVPTPCSALGIDPIGIRSISIANSTISEMYMIDVDTGKERRVTGLQLTEFSRSGLDSIVEAGDNDQLHATCGWSSAFVKVITPSLLVNHLELVESSVTPMSANQLPDPYFTKD